MILGCLSWKDGRISTGYKKLNLFNNFLSRKFKFDAYLLYYPEGSSITPHTDPVIEGSHYRLNLVLIDCKQGGDFDCEQAIFKSRRLIIFRPDKHVHQVTRINRGYRLVLSIGKVISPKSPE